jgi:hypothetical protein
MRTLRSLLVLLLLALPAAALAGTGGGLEGARATQRSTGEISLTNSLGGSAIFTASALGPGDSTRGRVAIRNTGARTGRLALSQAGLQDTLGPGGGRLSDRLALTVRDVSSARTLYSGPFASMPRRDAGTLKAGQSRTFEFTANLPEGEDNALQGSSATVRYVWTAAESPEAPAATSAAEACRPSLRVPPRQRLLRHGRMVARVRVTSTCRVTVQAYARDRQGRKRYLFGARNRRLEGRGGHRVSLRLAPSVRKILRSRRHRAVRVSVRAGSETISRRARVR